MKKIDWASVAQILGIAGVAATVLLWAGSIQTTVAANTKAIETTPSVAADVAVLKSQIGQIQQDIRDVKSAQRAQETSAEQRQQEILDELRKR